MHRNTHAFSQGDLFHNFGMKKFEYKDGVGTSREILKKYKVQSKNVLVSKIFWAFLKLVFKDMIYNGTTFHLNTKNIAMFTWECLKGDVFTKVYQSGKYDNVDFLSTNFMLYSPIFKYFYRGKFKRKLMIFDTTLRTILCDKMNQGFKYC